MRCKGPDCKGEPGASKWIGPDKVQDVGDAQQWQKKEQTFQRFSAKKLK